MTRRDAQPDLGGGLSAGGVQLWTAPLDVESEALAALAQTLSRGERERAQRLRRDRDRERWTAARGWLRWLLGRYADVEPAELRFDCGEDGKPRLAGAAGRWRFNLSHSADLVTFAVAQDREVGVDVERVDQVACAEPVPIRFLSDAEQAVLARLAPPERTRVSLQYWTGKEAYLKATGSGLRASPGHVDTAMTLTPNLTPQRRPTDGGFGDWTLGGFDAGAGYVAAVVVQGAGVTLPDIGRPLTLADTGHPGVG